jgi:hypothetical protein
MAVTSAERASWHAPSHQNAPEPIRQYQGEMVMIEPMALAPVAVAIEAVAFVLVAVALAVPALGTAMFGSNLHRPTAAD